MKSKVRSDALPVAVFVPLGDCRDADICHRQNYNQTVRSNKWEKNTEKGSRPIQSGKILIDPDVAWF